MKDKRLTSSEREFMTLVSQAAFANPFSEDRLDLDLKISGLSRGASSGKRLEAALSRVRDFIKGLETSGRKGISLYSDEERRLVTIGYLFDIFHRFVDKLDNLIREQVAAGNVSCAVPFAGDVLGLLTEKGIPKKDAVRYLGVFYQLRRAFYFIVCSLVGRSASMKHLRSSLWNNVFTHDIQLYDEYLWNRMEDFSTLLLGETGTGKGAAAGAIGRSGFIPFEEKKGCFSESFMQSFISINLSQFTQTLIESELFGHRKGSFTGAVEAHEGVFARCSPHGSIFLDEIGDVSVPVQIKLLQVLQERQFSPVGSHEKKRFHGRVIAASNRSIDELRRQGLFRDDFFYRLCSDVITVPPLRTRLQEEPGELDDLLKLTICRLIGNESEGMMKLVKSVIHEQLGKDYGWPGNVRELEQCVRRVLLTRNYRGDSVSVSPDLRSRIKDNIDTGAYEAQTLTADYCKLLHRRYGTYEEVARRTGLDRRTVKKYVVQ
jgi:DNA-binding NtrC family response regulator